MQDKLIIIVLSLLSIIVLSLILWITNNRKFITSKNVASAYDSWTNDKLLERLWGEHNHLGFYHPRNKHIDFRKA